MTSDQRQPAGLLGLEPGVMQRDVAAIPSPQDLADTQIVEAVYRIHDDTQAFPQFRQRTLAALTGPMCPEDLVIVGARTGQGKTLFLQNVFDGLVDDGRCGLYVGLEQSAHILRTKWACIRAGVPPRLVLAPREDERGSAEWQRAMDLVQADLKWQRSDEIKAIAHFSAARTINAAGLRLWTQWAVEHGAQFIIVDHVDRIQHGEGRNPFHELSETIRLAKELAYTHKITMILASQLGRPSQPLQQFIPPALHDLRGAGTKEEEADTVLGIYRPLRAGVTDKQLNDVRRGTRDKDSVIEPNTMGVMVLKHRLDGAAAGKAVRLAVRRQRITDLGEAELWSRSASPLAQEIERYR